MTKEAMKILEQAIVEFDKLKKEYDQKIGEQPSEYDKNADQFWNSLSQEDKLKCFYSVCKRIHKGDIEDRGSYRYVLYDVFGFGPEAYMVGMNCGYMTIHNAIFTAEENNERDNSNHS